MSQSDAVNNIFLYKINARTQMLLIYFNFKVSMTQLNYSNRHSRLYVDEL